MSKQIKIVIFTISSFLLFLTCVSPLQSHPIQRIEIPSTLNPVGSGARAFGMGGAFIAVADDATAASWNPAALNNLERFELSMVVKNFHRIEHNTFGTNPESNGMQNVYKNSFNYFSFAYPFELETYSKTYPLVLSFNYQNLYDFDREWHLPFFVQTKDFVLNQNANYLQTGNLSALGLAGCIEVLKNLSVGLTINIWNNELASNHWEKKIFQKGNGTNEGHDFIFTYTATDDYEFDGYNVNFNLGFLWKKEYANHSFNIGAVIKTPFRADIIHKSNYKYFFHYLEKQNPEPDNSGSFEEKDTIDFPLSYGIGTALVFGRRNFLKVDFDLYVTDWKDYIITDTTENENSFSDDKRTIQIRLGMEYLLFRDNYRKRIPFRTGLFYDPVPGDDCIDNYYGFTLGFGLHKENIQFDFGYQYRFGNNVSKYIYKSLNFSQDVEEYTFCASLIYRL